MDAHRRIRFLSVLDQSLGANDILPQLLFAARCLPICPARSDMTKSSLSKVRVRFAPSPTGSLHIGGLRTALFNYFFARRHSGAFVLRIEDTDQARFVREAEWDILSGLKWAGIEPDEGPQQGGDFAPYRQSERQVMYALYAQQLIDEGHAYYAFDTPEEIEAMRERFATEENPSPKYDATTRGEMTNSLGLSGEEVRERIERGDAHVIRLKVDPGGRITFQDHIRGRVSFSTGGIDDQVLIKSDGMPTYHLANVVDDHAMGITHVIRGEEWLSSTPKHILLYQALGWEPPEMAHMPLIMNPGGKGKLSKRHAETQGLPVTVEQCQLAGYEPEAVINFLALLGWNPGDDKEIFSLDEMAELFSLDRVNGGGVQFDVNKINWFNQQYVRGFSVDQLLERAEPHVRKNASAWAAGFFKGEERRRQIAALMQPRITFSKDLSETGGYFFEDPTTYDEAAVKKRWKEGSAELLSAYADRLGAASDFDAAQAEAMLRALAEERGAGAGRIIHPVRLAVSGVPGGPSLFDMMEVLGREVCVRRIRKAVEVLG